MSILYTIYLTVLSICLFIGIFCYTKLTNQTKLIFFYVFLNLGIEYIGTYFLYFSEKKQVKSIIYEFQSIFEIVFLGLYFRALISRKYIKKIIPILVIIILSIYVILAINRTTFGIANFNVFTISNIFFTILSILYFKELLNTTDNLFENSNFWFVTAILFFNSCFFFLSGFINKIKEGNLELAKSLFQINHILNIIFCILLSYGFICQARLAKRS